ncbi:kynureninase [Deinococcus aquiradiocola]|uniref:Kynureninase n=1 Tax=Deinococcus aquiradiocola TaxID=393059 RepID=A0A917PMX4_9DEIO|nr:kynureninase [Deinococcus aquiradiocola]GGJ84952.1 kynureninase [Deinococcus aquiradiocola]
MPYPDAAATHLTPAEDAVPADLLALDATDPLARTRDLFSLPDSVLYLDGNSLGALPAHVPDRVAQVVTREWGDQLIRSWTGDAAWMTLPDRVAARLAPLLGARPEQVAVSDSTSVNLFKLLSAALHLQDTASGGTRRVILTDADNFPTDLYVAQGLNALLRDRYELRRVPALDLAGAFGPDVAVLLATEVDYRTGERLDLPGLTRDAHAHGVLTVWDLAHSAGAFPLDLRAADVDFALGCGYKFLNGGPGAPSFVYVSERHLEGVPAFLSGWMGHAEPFEMAREYRPAAGARRFVVGTPGVLNLAALDAALEVFGDVDLHALRTKSLGLTDTFIRLMAPVAARHGLTLVTPLEHARRGSQVSYRHARAGELMTHLIRAGVIGDYRTPDILRFGFTPLYLSYADTYRAAQRTGAVLDAVLGAAQVQA